MVVIAEEFGHKSFEKMRLDQRDCVCLDTYELEFNSKKEVRGGCEREEHVYFWWTADAFKAHGWIDELLLLGDVGKFSCFGKIIAHLEKRYGN